ncbi:NET1-associated nuclear protein 1 [Blastocladiella emersonii ATCC 22665]|nr:NET1-associated nuclear protein 1 [Blastocladiella emersonii ATCC 22665]
MPSGDLSSPSPVGGAAANGADTAAEETQILSLSKVVGGQLSSHPPLFTADSASVLCIASSSIKIFSANTTQQLRVISPPDHPSSHTANITALALSPKNPFQVYSAGLDGSIRLWDINDGALLKTWDLQASISHFRIHPAQPNLAFIVMTKSSGRSARKINSIVYAIDLNTTHIRRIMKTRICSAFDVSTDGKCIALASKFKLHVGTLEERADAGSDAQPLRLDDLVYSTKCYVNNKKMTCVAVHPTDNCVAAGDESGRIKLWHVLGLSDEEAKNPLVQTFHWHARCVNHITFTLDGRQLLSGGDEARLVVWQLETSQKDFSKGLGAEILSISVSPDMMRFAVATLDNSIRFVDTPSFTVQQSVVGLKSTAITATLNTAGSQQQLQLQQQQQPGAASAADVVSLQPPELEDPFTKLAAAGQLDDTSLRALLTIEPRNGHIALEGTPGTVQFYNLHADCHVLDLAVVPYNYIPGEGVVTPKVTHLAFDPTGTWMATFDERRGSTCTLRIWLFKTAEQRYELNTRIDSLPRIHSLAFRPTTTGDAMLATTQDGGQFSVWEMIKVAAAPGNPKVRVGAPRPVWRCRSSGYYRGLTPRSAAWSADGSILAVAFGVQITLWDPASLVLAGVLTADHLVTAVRLGSATCPYIVGLDAMHVSVWNLLTLEPAWSYAAPTLRAFAVCPKRDHLAIVTAAPSAGGSPASPVEDAEDAASRPTSRLTLFNLVSPVPVSIQDIADDVLAVTFTTTAANAAPEDTQLVYLTREHNLKVLSAPRAHKALSAATVAAAAARPSVVAGTAPRTSVFIRRPTAGPQAAAAAAAAPAAPTSGAAARAVAGMPPAIAALLEAPAHAIPSVESVFETLLGSLLELNL